MEIKCPRCGSSFENDKIDIPPEGREFYCVRCKKKYFGKLCGDSVKTWFITKQTSISISNGQKVIIIFAGIVGVCLMMLIISSVLLKDENKISKKPPEPTPQELAQLAEKQEASDSFDAITYAKIYVKKSLKAPSTAKFQDETEFGVSPKRDKKGDKIKDVWEVSGYVDAQNSFGAMLRQQWYVKMKKVNNSWLLLDIKFGE